MKGKGFTLIATGLLVVFISTGCRTTGGIIGGLIPAPKFTKGDLTDGLYLAQDMSFSVVSPFPEDSYAYTYMSVSEEYTEKEINVVFSSSAAPAEVYRVNVYKNIQPVAGVEAFFLDSYRTALEGAYNTPFEKREAQQISVSNVSTTLHTYFQHIPERSERGRKLMSFDVLHSCFYLAKVSTAAFVCLNRIEGGTPLAGNSDERVQAFIQSFQLL